MSNMRGGIALGILLTGILGGLKLTGLITWTWLAVLAPLGISLALHVLIIAVTMVVFLGNPDAARQAAADQVTDDTGVDNLAGARAMLTLSGMPYVDDDGEYVAPYDFERLYKDR